MAADLLAGLVPASGDTARRVVVGLNWTMVEGPHGTGLAQTPPRGAQGCRAPAESGSLAGRTLAWLAGHADDSNPAMRAVALAAINADVNRRTLAGAADSGLSRLDPAVSPTVVIGRFPRLERHLPRAQVIELEPREGEHPASAAATLVPAARQLVITASTLVNGTAGGLLGLVPPGCRVALVGPSTPLAPALHDRGIGILAGFVVEDAERAARIVMEGGAVSALKPVGRYVVLERP